MGINDIRNPSTYLGAFLASGDEPRALYQEQGFGQGLSRIVGSYLVDPAVDFMNAGAQGMEGKLTVKGLQDLQGGLFDVAGMSLASSVLNKMDPNVVRMFVGPSALKKKAARKMEAAGVGRDTIHRELLMHRKPDGQWRQEIDDSAADLTTQANFNGFLGDKVDHPELFDRYPSLKDEMYQTKDMPLNTFGSAGPSGISMNKNLFNTKEYLQQATNAKHVINNPKDYGVSQEDLPKYEQIYKLYGAIANNPEMKRRNTMFHELQHKVQRKEQWQHGASSSKFDNVLPRHIRDWRKDADQEYMAGNITRAQHAQKTAALDKLLKDKKGPRVTAYAQYANLLGEREARDTARRKNWTLKERRATTPDYGDDASIYKFLQGILPI